MDEESSLPASVQCANCGCGVAADAPSGLCPTCLLRTAIEHGAGQLVTPFLPRLHYFGDYELLEEVARGGMGVVYRAKQVSLDRTVAVKMMRPGLLSSEAEIQRFHTEAKTAAGLQHPNIVAIHEVGEFDGLHYFSMDFVEGPSLAALVRERPLSQFESARYVRVLAETIAYAHARGILHRDLKPSNVLVDAAGRPRITDFGLARHFDRDAEMTAAGAVVGTPAYMPPEQAAGRDDRVGPAADVYSLGAILYELITGKPPFRAALPAETIRMVIEEQPRPPRSLNPDVSADLEAICLHCLEKDPAKRYGSAGELADALDGFLGSPIRTRRNKWLALAAVAAILVLTSLAIVMNLYVSPAKLPQVHPPASAAAVPVTQPPLAQAKKGIKKQGRVADRVTEAHPNGVAFSISPANGTGFSQTFRVGDANARQVELDFHDSKSAGDRHCDLLVDAASGKVQLQYFPDRGPGIRVSGSLGTLARLDNSVCAVDLSKGSSNGDAVELPIIFKPGFEGLKRIESWRLGSTGHRVDHGASGSWTVGP